MHGEGGRYVITTTMSSAVRSVVNEELCDKGCSFHQLVVDMR